MQHYSIYQNTDNSGIVSYGIILSDGNTPVRVIEDISREREEIELLTQIFNDEGLDPIHLDQAVEDFLIDRQI